MISFCITVCNEHLELSRLLTQLVDYISEDDQIVIQGDHGNVTDEVHNVVLKYLSDPRVVYVTHPLNKDFATFKNNALKHCTKDWIFLIDADEYFIHTLLDSLKPLLNEYSDIDLFNVPRKNTVEGITNEYARSQGWNLSKFSGETLINFPDRQQRLFKNNKNIHYINKVHERLVGFDNVAELPYLTEEGEGNFMWCLLHPKTIERQVKQNKFYETIG